MLLRSTPARRKVALGVASALLLAPTLSACGFNYATDRYYTPGVGANNRAGDVDVLSAVIVTEEGNSGVFVASFANGTDAPVAVSSVGGIDRAQLAATEIADLEVPANGLVNLALQETPVEVSGEFSGGQFIPLMVTFANGESAQLDVPVVLNCGIYAETNGLPTGDKLCTAGEERGAE